MEVLGILAVIAGMVAVVLITPLRAKAWMDFIHRTSGKNDE